MKCNQLISYGKDGQLKRHKKPTKNSEICGGMIDVSVHVWDDPTYGDSGSIKYSCFKCQKGFNPHTIQFPANLDELREYLIQQIGEKS